MNIEFPWWEKAKEHVEKHKVAYSCGATAIVVAGITSLIMKRRYAVLGYAGADGSDEITVRPLSILSNKQNTNVITVIKREGAGHPGYRTRCQELDFAFDTQAEAARTIGVTDKIMSDHLNGKLPDAGGYHCERIPA